MESKVAFLQAGADAADSVIEWQDADYNYLAIGNSITRHGINEYWWNENGMAATKTENDFVHQTASMLQSKTQKNVRVYAHNFSVWELMSTDRTQTLQLLDGLLSDKLNLVTIQLSENATDLSTFASDFEALIRYVQQRAKNAQIIVVGDFWDADTKDEMKMQACGKCAVEFVNLDEIKDDVKYKCGMGTIVYDAEGNEHTVDHNGVARHPNDTAMAYMAMRIVECIE